MVPIPVLTEACSNGKWISCFLVFLAYCFFISLFMILEGKKEERFKWLFFFSTCGSSWVWEDIESTIRISMKRRWMKQAEERVLDYIHPWAVCGREELCQEWSFQKSEGHNPGTHWREEKMRWNCYGLNCVPVPSPQIHMLKS